MPVSFTLNRSFLIFTLYTLLFCAGCAEKKAPTTSAAATEESLEVAEVTEAELSEEDQALVKVQMFCPVGGKLGEMGTPVKVVIEGQPIFICCEHCREPFLKDPQKYLSALKDKKQEASETPTEPAKEEATEKEAS